MSEDWSFALPTDPGNSSHYYAQKKRPSQQQQQQDIGGSLGTAPLSTITSQDGSTAKSFASIQQGASLLISFRPTGRSVLIVGSGKLAASRAFTCLEAGAKVIIAPIRTLGEDRDEVVDVNQELQWRHTQGQLELRQPSLSFESSNADPLARLGLDPALLDLEDLSLVIVAVPPSTSDVLALAQRLSQKCRDLRIPLTVHDRPECCDFAFLSSHRDGHLQLGVTTNGMGCRLAGRIRREAVGRLPRGSAQAVERLGKIRNSIKVGQTEIFSNSGHQVHLPAVPIGSANPDDLTDAKRRMEWLAQISEYWPIDYLARLDEDEIRNVMQGYIDQRSQTKDGSPKMRSSGQRDDLNESTQRLSLADQEDHRTGRGGSDAPSVAAARAVAVASRNLISPDRNRRRRRSSATRRGGVSSSPSPHRLNVQKLPPPRAAKGQIILVGSGPGSPALLTLAAYNALTSTFTTLVLCDKLVPSPVVDLVPNNTPLVVARKFPGVADDAQDELQRKALEHAQGGGTVVRLKQGDPFVFGRGGEEVAFFRTHGFEPIVIPGISSALAGPLLGGIPVTHRGVADQVLITTGVGRKGKAVVLPGYNPSRTLVILMAMARLEAAVHALTTHDEQEAMSTENVSQREGSPYPPLTPVAIIERASCLDQRVIISTLQSVQEVIENKIKGGARPPGLLVIGWSVIALLDQDNAPTFSKKEVDQLTADSGHSASQEKVVALLGPEGYRILEGLPEGWMDFEAQVLDESAPAIEIIKEEGEYGQSAEHSSADDVKSLGATFPHGTTIPIFSTISSFRAWHNTFASSEQLGFVPTMGALHSGHLALIKESITCCNKTVISIFVNPAQFAPTEDLASYPRTLEKDLQVLESLKHTDGRTIDAILLPQVGEMYPNGITQDVAKQVGAFIEVKGRSHQMEGASRPTFFRGVATVVTKLLNIVQPQHVFFGQKDIQQCMVIRSLIDDLLIPTKIHVVKTTRDSNTGLALSSRNVYLSSDELAIAPCLYRALHAARDEYVQHGKRARSELLGAAEFILDASAVVAAQHNIQFKLLYISLTNPKTLDEVDNVDPKEGAILSAALFLGKTRLIDNLLIGFWP